MVTGGGVRLWEVEEEQLGCEYWFKKADVGERLLSLCDGLKSARGEGEGLLEGAKSSSKSSGGSAEAPSENLEKKGFPLRSPIGGVLLSWGVLMEMETSSMMGDLLLAGLGLGGISIGTSGNSGVRLLGCWQYLANASIRSATRNDPINAH